MRSSYGSLMGKLEILVVLIVLAATAVSCSSDDGPVTPPAGNRAPGAPTIDTAEGAPANGAVDVATTINLHWNCTDADGDTLAYTVHFGEANPPVAVSSGQPANHYQASDLANATTFYWKVVATDPDDASTSSPVWSFTTVAAGVESVSDPDAPVGPGTGLENEDLQFTATGAASTQGHDLEYRFGWDDGTTSDWGTTAVQHSWATAGSYDVTAQARCIAHPAIESEWSAAKTVVVTVYGAETISVPNTPAGSLTGETGQSLNYTTGGSVSSDGHTVEYSFDWGNGTVTSFSTLATRSYTWNTPGVYEVKVQARCNPHTHIVSAWSDILTVTISAAAVETVSTPDAPDVPPTATASVGFPINISGGVSSFGHAVQHRVDFGDGTTSTWYSSLTTIQHTYAAGTYDIAVQARCTQHPDIESDWSATSTVVVSDPAETITSPPGTIWGVTDGGINESYEYNVAHGTVTNLGHEVEGRYDWGDGTYSDWSTAADNTAFHAWTSEGLYTVNYQARCTLHPEISADATPLEVTINTVATETVSTPGYVNYDRYAITDIAETYYAYGGESSLGHDTETRFDWGDGSPVTDWVPTFTPVDKTWTTAGYYTMTRQSRCIEHPDIVSEWGGGTGITVRDPETVSAPNAPDGPTTGHRSSYLYYTTSGSVSSWDHPTIEVRFDWGDGTALSDWSDPETSVRHLFTALGTYDVTAQSRCSYASHDPIESEWSAATTVTIVEVISTSNYSPSGPEYAGMGESYAFSAPYARSDSGHALEYRFDWGDGAYSDWSASDEASHSWAAAGPYTLAYQARCAEHTTAVSDWSYPLELTVTDQPESLTAPTVTHSSGTVTRIPVGLQIYVSASESIDTYGHPIEYQIDFGDGNVSEWMSATETYGVFYGNVQYTYTEMGTFEVTAKARCATHPAIESPVSEAHSITIYENITIPGVPDGPLTGTIGENLTYTCTASTSSEGHVLEYSFEYRTGSYSVFHQSDWSTSLSDTHVFDAAISNVRVRTLVRCVDHPEAEAASALSGYITITAK